MERYALLPTPITPIKRYPLSHACQLYIKRDDLTGLELSGNKIRKLEYAIDEALKQGATHLLTCGGSQSNHCRATAALGAKVGLPVILFLRHTPSAPDGNLFLNTLLGAQIHWLSPDADGHAMSMAMSTHAEILKEKGAKPYLIPLGASNGIGALGYRQAFEEIIAFEKDNAITFDAIVSAVGSGGTFAGLLLGQMKHEHRAKHIGFSVGGSSAYFRTRIGEIVEESRDYLPKDEKSTPIPDFDISDRYVGQGYGIADPSIYTTIETLGKSDGILLDPVYTGKAFYGLTQELGTGLLSTYKNILFIHTGGSFGLFAYKNHFSSFTPTP